MTSTLSRRVVPCPICERDTDVDRASGVCLAPACIYLRALAVSAQKCKAKPTLTADLKGQM